MAKRVLVTGGAGFIGSHICEHFLERSWTVEVADDLSTGKRENLPSGLTLHVLDVRSEDAARLVRDGAFDALIHVAGQIDVRKSVADPVFDAGVNVIGTVNLLEALRSSPHGKKCRVLFSSTGGALYGDFVTPPNKETAPKDPESPYAVGKLAAEYYLAYYGRVHGLNAVALRFGNVYGPRQDPHGEAGVIAIFCGRILDARPLTIFGDGRQTRDYVYVRDVAAATFAAASKALPPVERLDSRAFNIGTGVATSVTELANVLLKVADAHVPIEHAPPRPGEQQHSVLNVTKASESLGWKPAVTLAEGLKASFDWFTSRHRALAGRP